MASYIMATEKDAYDISETTNSYTATKLCTKSRATTLGCSVSGTYTDSLIVCKKDLGVSLAITIKDYISLSVTSATYYFSPNSVTNVTALHDYDLVHGSNYDRVSVAGYGNTYTTIIYVNTNDISINGSYDSISFLEGFKKISLSGTYTNINLPGTLIDFNNKFSESYNMIGIPYLNVSNFIFNNSNTEFSIILDCLIKNNTLYLAKSSITNLTIPNNITTLKSGCLYNPNINFPTSLTTIESNVYYYFSDSDDLESIFLNFQSNTCPIFELDSFIFNIQTDDLVLFTVPIDRVSAYTTFNNYLIEKGCTLITPVYIYVSDINYSEDWDENYLDYCDEYVYDETLTINGTVYYAYYPNVINTNHIPDGIIYIEESKINTLYTASIDNPINIDGYLVDSNVIYTDSDEVLTCVLKSSSTSVI